MQYYKLINDKVELTNEGKKALSTLGITLEELRDYSDEKLNSSHWQECKTYVDQAMKNGKGVTWLDDCRIPYEGENGWEKVDREHSGCETGHIQQLKNRTEGERQSNPRGRFPANLLCQDDILNDGKVRKCGSSIKNPSTSYVYGGNSLLKSKTKGNDTMGYGDSGSFSRYFSLDAWDEGARKTFPFVIVPKASKSEKNKGLEGMEEKKKWLKGGTGTGISAREDIVAKNFHPTVKPLKLMRYLITLTTREGDVVLDPFIGSGTTAVACTQLNRKWVGIELNEKYCEIASARIKSEADESEQDMFTSIGASK